MSAAATKSQSGRQKRQERLGTPPLHRKLERHPSIAAASCSIARPKWRMLAAPPLLSPRSRSKSNSIEEAKESRGKSASILDNVTSFFRQGSKKMDKDVAKDESPDDLAEKSKAPCPRPASLPSPPSHPIPSHAHPPVFLCLPPSHRCHPSHSSRPYQKDRQIRLLLLFVLVSGLACRTRGGKGEGGRGGPTSRGAPVVVAPCHPRARTSCDARPLRPPRHPRTRSRS